MGSYQEERERFVDVWARNGGRYHSARLVMKYANAVERRAVADCNGEALDERAANACRNAMTAIQNICKENGFSVRFGGDPRGYTTKIAFPDGSHNTMGGAEDGWGVPTR